jgi:predicted nucleic acid-binding protein
VPGLTLDAGALIAFERNDRPTVALVARSLVHGYTLAVPAGVVAQVWRDGRRQVRLARLLSADEVDIVVLDDQRAREAGQLCGVRCTHDIVDASVVLCARARRHRIVTSDPDDLKRLDPDAMMIAV